MRYVAALGIPLLALLSFTLVTAWTGPTASPPNGNVAPPINVGTAQQVKNGTIGVNNSSYSEILSSAASPTPTPTSISAPPPAHPATASATTTASWSSRTAAAPGRASRASSGTSAADHVAARATGPRPATIFTTPTPAMSASGQRIPLKSWTSEAAISKWDMNRYQGLEV